jgi:hypothetical protein
MAVLKHQDKTEIVIDDGYLLITQVEYGSGVEQNIAIAVELIDEFIGLIRTEQRNQK